MTDKLFRGKTTTTNEWVYGYVVKGAGTYIITPESVEYIRARVDYMGCVQLIAVNPATVGQYTGLADDNGAKIFEDDILELNQYGLVIVVYRDGCFGAIEGGAFGPLMPSLWGMGGKVVGNKHDNPRPTKGASI